MTFSLLPVLLATQLVAWWFVATRAQKLSNTPLRGLTVMRATILCLAIWAILSGYLAASGVYDSRWFIHSWPALWVTSVSVIIIVTALIVSRSARELLAAIVETTPLPWLIGIQSLRLLAIGGILKGLNGEFSLYYALFIGIPDFLFGVSALVLTWLACQERVGRKTVVIWSLLGALIIVPFGQIFIQFGLPGRWQLFDQAPGISTIFDLPMALAPTVVVPLFVFFNLALAVTILSNSNLHKLKPADHLS